MGVKYLASHIGGCYAARRMVSLKTMADDHRRTYGCQPVIVVDGSNVVSWIYLAKENSLECIYGGQWLQFVNILKKFKMRFENIGVKLVFIFDGTICSSKRQTWIQRTEEKSEKIASLFNLIRQNNNKAIKQCENIPISLRILARIALKELDIEMYQTNKEVDPDNFIADYANKNDSVFAILSSDTDFIIYQTKPHLSLYHLDLSSMRTILYDRKCFAERYLNIQVKQLPLFACLMGNDSIPYDDLKSFHEQFLDGESYAVMKTWEEKKKKLSIVIQNICDLIRNIRWTGDFPEEQELEDISEKVFILNRLKHFLEKHSTLLDKCSPVCIYNLFCIMLPSSDRQRYDILFLNYY
ncbi:constitutive coactivator of peroxisome proliferator-activated receptor gamma [Nephila pilipes]|uniref:Constitutive coactivator of peroxisome proliferator-activated receptor gamma n=1 Tax=Nephila pilipes TaxID=299642 RepID=A0A8X6TE82_NEPPI|nr:constitutive coactivator of peroxisome proliferator-activated receptor gamma [Nephila pilipes]GFT05439.1 constitutive coactivator of peroxisome proliferator-activated receptor gamma [Nephila pilipes]